MEIEEFAERLSTLRQEKGVSARDMSRSIGQNENYINNIENKKAFPSMTSFFYICEFLKIYRNYLNLWCKSGILIILSLLDEHNLMHISIYLIVL